MRPPCNSDPALLAQLSAGAQSTNIPVGPVVVQAPGGMVASVLNLAPLADVGNNDELLAVLPGHILTPMNVIEVDGPNGSLLVPRFALAQAQNPAGEGSDLWASGNGSYVAKKVTIFPGDDNYLFVETYMPGDDIMLSDIHPTLQAAWLEAWQNSQSQGAGIYVGTIPGVPAPTFPDLLAQLGETISIHKVAIGFSKVNTGTWTGEVAFRVVSDIPDVVSVGDNLHPLIRSRGARFVSGENDLAKRALKAPSKPKAAV